jgi:hypothetical protein
MRQKKVCAILERISNTKVVIAFGSDVEEMVWMGYLAAEELIDGYAPSVPPCSCEGPPSPATTSQLRSLCLLQIKPRSQSPTINPTRNRHNNPLQSSPYTNRNPESVNLIRSGVLAMTKTPIISKKKTAPDRQKTKRLLFGVIQFFLL